jgi:hypothetical protein
MSPDILEDFSALSLILLGISAFVNHRLDFGQREMDRCFRLCPSEHFSSSFVLRWLSADHMPGMKGWKCLLHSHRPAEERVCRNDLEENSQRRTNAQQEI